MFDTVLDFMLSVGLIAVAIAGLITLFLWV